MKQELTVAQGAAGRRLDVYLAGVLGMSRSQVQRLIKAGSVQINDQPVRANYLMTAGDRVQVAAEPTPTTSMPAPNLPVIYEDTDMLVVDKPAGLAVHAGNGLRVESTVADFARAHTTDPDPERPGIVHRLDRDTSGLLVIAKSAAAKQYLQDQWRGRRVEKTYQLLVVGRIEPSEAIINMPLDRDPAHPLRRHVSPGGRAAVTRYRTVAVYPGYCFLEAYPETGRTHQLRVHMAALGHPVAGDIVYGPSHRPLGLGRHFLHASRLALLSPAGRKLELSSPLPPELAAVLTHLDDLV